MAIRCAGVDGSPIAFASTPSSAVVVVSITFRLTFYDPMWLLHFQQTLVSITQQPAVTAQRDFVRNRRELIQR